MPTIRVTNTSDGQNGNLLVYVNGDEVERRSQPTALDISNVLTYYSSRLGKGEFGSGKYDSLRVDITLEVQR